MYDERSWIIPTASLPYAKILKTEVMQNSN